MMPERISIIIPVLNEATGIEALLASLATLRAAGHEVIVVDGGSQDGTAGLARPLADRVLESPPGRARQMNAGAGAAAHDILLFLHADSAVPGSAAQAIVDCVRQGKEWGHFRLKLSGRHPLLRVVETGINWRTRLSAIVTGDMGMFVTRQRFRSVGGFGDIPLMEDVAISGRLRRHGHPARLAESITTSSRRWEERGILRTVLLMWRLRLAYRFGVDPQRLVRAYYPEHSGNRQP